jgi:hypothetical protein
MEALEDELRLAVHGQESRMFFQINGKRVEFERSVREAHRKLKMNFFTSLTTLLITKTFMPTGGWIRPSLTVITMITPNQMGSKPSAVTGATPADAPLDRVWRIRTAQTAEPLNPLGRRFPLPRRQCDGAWSVASKFGSPSLERTCSKCAMRLST